MASATYTIGAAAACPTQSDIPNFGPNVRIFDPTMSTATIQAQLDADFNAQKDTQTAQMGTGRVAHLFKPGTYGVHDNVGFYTSVAGLGQNPDDVTINGDVTVDAFNASDQGVALQNFWRSAENLAINPSSGSDRWAVAQAAPFRRIDVHGNLQLFPASFGFASGGYIADTKVSGQASSVSQQQWYTRDSSLGSWAGGVWNMVFSGTGGAPANTFPSPPETTLAHHAGLARRAVPVHRQHRQVPRVPAVAAHQRVRPELGQRQHARHVAADEPVLRRQGRRHRLDHQLPRWPPAATCSSPRASTTSTRRST